MLKYMSYTLALMFIAGIESPAVAQQMLHVMSFNIRFDNPADGENQWMNRKEKVASLLTFYETDVVGMQEVLYSQLLTLDTLLPEYAYVGTGRDDGKLAGEFSPILYRKDKFEALESQTFWLSETPETPGKSWDAALNRIVTWCRFKSRETGGEFFVFNTHFDHIGQVARRESARLLIRKVRDIAGDTPAVITGDFNSRPEDEPIRILSDALIETGAVSLTSHFGPDSTFNGFESKEKAGHRIDYIFINSKDIKVNQHATLSHTWEGRFASDHHPVLAVLTLEK